MKKKKYSIFIFLIFTIIQCKNDYENTIEKYFDYLKKENYIKAYSFFSTDDKRLISLDEYINEKDSSPISKNIIKRIKYNIIESRLSENKKSVLVKVEIREPDLLKIYKILPELLNIENNKKTIDKIFKKNIKIIDNNYKVKYENYKLVFEENKWVIYADYKKKKYLFELFEEAEKLFKDYFFKEALVIYERILEFNENDNYAIDRVIKIKEKIYYIEKYIEFDYEILKKNKNGVIIDIVLINKGTIVVKKAVTDFLFYKNKTLVFKEKRILFDKNDVQLGFNEKFRKETVINEIEDNFDDVKCIVTAIEFQ